jgi:hypothetical protein
MARVVREWGWDPGLGAILAGALIVRLGYGLFAGLGTPPDGRLFVIDEQEYYLAGHMLANGHGFSFYDTFTWTRAPLYPLFVAGIFRLVGVQVAPVLWVQAALSTLTLYWLATLAGRVAAPILSRTAARRGTALIGALWLTPTLFAQLLVSETLFLGLFVGALVVLARWADGREAANAAPREQWRLLGGAGVLLGLAALTRSTALAFLPLVAGWVAWAGWRTRAGWARWLAPALVLGAAALVIAPWTARNIAAYGLSPGGPVLIDTSSGYNLWLAANGVRDGERLASELRGIDGVLARQQHALAQAQAQIAADPGAFVAKGLKESLDLWTINPSAEERQVGGATAGRVPGRHLLTVLVLEDGLYLAIGALGLLGLGVARPDPLKALIGLWIVLWMAMAFVFFAVTRFRFPVVACLLPWVPVGAAWLGQRVGRAQFRLQPVAQVAGLLAVVFLLIVGPTLPVEATAQGVARWFEQAPFRAGEVALRAGHPAAALVQYAQAAQTLPDTRFGTLAAQIAANPTASVELAALARNPALDLGPTGMYNTRMEPYLLQGQIARLQGDPAQAARLFTSRPVNDAGMAALSWAAEHFITPESFGQTLDVGSGLATGYVQGMYGVEQDGGVTYRWMGATAVLVPPGPYSTTVRLRWNGWRPAGWPPATVVVAFNYCGDDTCGTQQQTLLVPNDQEWHDQDLAFDRRPDRLLQVVLQVNTFVPGGSDPRELGIRIDRLEWIR